MSDQFLLLDVSSAPIADAVSYLEPVSAPSNWKDEVKIAAYVAEKTAKELATLALDVDLAQVTGVAWWHTWDDRPQTEVANQAYNMTEADLLKIVADRIRQTRRVITYGGINFDLPLLMRRARWLGVDFPRLSLKVDYNDPVNSPNPDLCEILSDRKWDRRKPLKFYIKRHGWTDISKPLSGSEEARVLESGRWAELEASLHHDITAIHRLSQWLKIWTPTADTQAQEVIL